MARYALRRVLAALPVLLGVAVAVFLMLWLTPGDPVQLLVRGEILSPKEIEEIRQRMGLSDPLPIQFLRFLSGAVTGDLGKSIVTTRPVIQEILSQLPASAELTLAGTLLAVAVGVLLGVAAATRHNSWLDNGSMVVAIFGVSMPSFWLGLLLMYTFSLKLNWFPPMGTGGLSRLVLPAITLGLAGAAVIARQTRSAMLEVLRMDYIQTARAKGLAERVVIYRHALKNAMIPVVTIIGLQFGRLLTGAIVIESVFARRGLGNLLVTGILNRDFPMVQGTVLYTAVVYVFVNLVVDLSYGLLDPRIRYD